MALTPEQQTELAKTIASFLPDTYFALLYGGKGEEGALISNMPPKLVKAAMFSFVCDGEMIRKEDV